MAYVVKMPKLGLEMKSGELSVWLVAEGEEVTEGEPIAEIESEKTTAEISAKEDGVLRRVLLAEGESTAPGGSVAIVAGADEDISGLEAEAGGAATDAGAEDATADADAEEPETAAASSGSQSAVTRQKSSASETGASEVRASPRAKQVAEELGVDLTTVEGTGYQGSITEEDVEAAAESEPSESAAEQAEVRASPRAKQVAEELGVDLTTVEGTGYQGSITEEDVEAAAESAPSEPAEEPSEGAAGKRVFAPPSARRLARELGVDIERVTGSGKNGRITESDVRAAAESGGEAEGTEPEPVEMERPLSGMRRTIADRLGESYRESVHVTVNRGADAEELLAAASAADDALGVDVSISDVLMLAVSAALDEYPAFNATFEDDVHRLHEAHNVCVAVDIDEGLIAPVVRDVGSLSLAELAAERQAVTQRALSGDFTMDDLTGGTFTISNLGVLGVESFDPIINPPQVAILGVNTIRREVVPTDEGDVAVRKRISFSLSFDHRIVDGADAARFLGSLVEHVENPWSLVIAAGGS